MKYKKIIIILFILNLFNLCFSFGIPPECDKNIKYLLSHVQSSVNLIKYEVCKKEKDDLKINKIIKFRSLVHSIWNYVKINIKKSSGGKVSSFPQGLDPAVHQSMEECFFKNPKIMAIGDLCSVPQLDKKIEKAIIPCLVPKYAMKVMALVGELPKYCSSIKWYTDDIFSKNESKPFNLKKIIKNIKTN